MLSSWRQPDLDVNLLLEVSRDIIDATSRIVEISAWTLPRRFEY